MLSREKSLVSDRLLEEIRRGVDFGVVENLRFKWVAIDGGSGRQRALI